MDVKDARSDGLEAVRLQSQITYAHPLEKEEVVLQDLAVSRPATKPALSSQNILDRLKVNTIEETYRRKLIDVEAL